MGSVELFWRLTFVYKRESVYVIGEAKSPENNPITLRYNLFYIGFVIDVTNDQIIDAECSATLEITKSFVQSLFTGKSMWDTEKVTDEVQRRYFGSSQRALIVAYKNAQKKYKDIKSK